MDRLNDPKVSYGRHAKVDPNAKNGTKNNKKALNGSSEHHRVSFANNNNNAKNDNDNNNNNAEPDERLRKRGRGRQAANGKPQKKVIYF